MPAYKGAEPYVFVCYSHADAAVVYPEMHWLQSRDVRPWYDAGISGGAVWRAEIADAIRGAGQFLVYLSAASVASAHCLREIDYALDQSVPVLPVYLDNVVLPSGLDLALNRVQALHRASTADYQDTLLAALGRRDPVQRLPARRRPPGPAVAAFVALLMLAAGAGGLLWSVDEREVPALTRSISIAPFEAIGEEEAAALAAAVGEEVAGLLSSYQELRTLDVEQAASYRLDGSVQVAETGHRIRVHLKRTHDGLTVWSGAFDAAEADPTRSIARYVRLQLVRDHECESIRRRAVRAEAAEYLCAALADTNRVNQDGDYDVEKQRTYAERAIELDPTLAHSYWLAAPSYYTRNDVKRAREILEQGLVRVPDDTAILWVYAWALCVEKDLNYRLAEERLLRAVEMDPLDPRVRWYYGALGYSALQQGDPHRAVDWYQRAVSVFDADGRIWSEYANALNAAGRYQDALAAADAGLELIRTGVFYDLLVASKATSLAALDRVEQARQFVEDAKPATALKVLSFAAIGDVRAIEAWMREFGPARATPLQMAVAYTALGDMDHALQSLHRMIDVRDSGLWVLRSHIFDGLRRDPRWPLVIAHLEREEAKGAAGVLYEGPPPSDE